MRGAFLATALGVSLLGALTCAKPRVAPAASPVAASAVVHTARLAPVVDLPAPAGTAIVDQRALTFRQADGVATQTRDAGPPGVADAPMATKISFTAQPRRFWDVEVTAHELRIERGRAYKLTFWAKAAAPRSLYVDVSHDGPPYTPVGYEDLLRIGPGWDKHELVFVADADPRPRGRVVFKLGHTTETVWLAGFRFEPADPSQVPVVDATKVVDAALPPALEARVQKTIREVRQGPLQLTVLDAKGKPVPGAVVRVRLLKHAFLFGQTLPDRDWSKDQRAPWQEKFLALWEPLTSLVVPENSTKARSWQRSTKEALSIWSLSKELDIPFKSHAPIWGHEFQEGRRGSPWDCEKIKADVEPRLDAEFAAFKGHHAYSDLANEMVSAPLIQEACGGEQVLIDWYERAHAIDPDVKLTVNEYGQMRGRGTRVDELVKRFKAAGAPIAVQGEQLHDADAWYPPEEVWGLLDRMAANGVEVHLTEVVQPDNGAPIRGGYLERAVWNSGNQAAYLAQTYRLAFGHPAVGAVVMWSFWDGASWRPRGGIVDQAFRPKPAYEALRELITRTWTTDFTGRSNARGEASGRGFYGTYEVTVTSSDGRSTVFRERLEAGKPTSWRLTLDNR